MGEDVSRNAMLAAVRGAVARWNAATPDAFPWPTASRQRSASIDQFVAAAESVQASVSVVSDFAEARMRVAAIVAEQGADQVGITGAAYGVADTGTIVVCSGPEGGRVESLLPPVHIALLRASDLVGGLPELLAALTRDGRFETCSAVTLITGPSRTADIELTLTIGVHGPKQLFVVVVDS